MEEKICGTYLLTNGDKILISGYKENNYETGKYGEKCANNQTWYVNQIQLFKNNGISVDITDLVIDFELDEKLLDYCR